MKWQVFLVHVTSLYWCPVFILSWQIHSWKIIISWLVTHVHSEIRFLIWWKDKTIFSYEKNTVENQSNLSDCGYPFIPLGRERRFKWSALLRKQWFVVFSNEHWKYIRSFVVQELVLSVTGSISYLPLDQYVCLVFQCKVKIKLCVLIMWSNEIIFKS